MISPRDVAIPEFNAFAFPFVGSYRYTICILAIEYSDHLRRVVRGGIVYHDNFSLP